MGSKPQRHTAAMVPKPASAETNAPRPLPVHFAPHGHRHHKHHQRAVLHRIDHAPIVSGAPTPPFTCACNLRLGCPCSFPWEASLGVHRERHLESVSRMEVLAGPSGKRHWSDVLKGRIVAETLVPGVTVNGKRCPDHTLTA